MHHGMPCYATSRTFRFCNSKTLQAGREEWWSKTTGDPDISPWDAVGRFDLRRL